MPLSNILFKEIMQGIITAQTPALNARLKGGISPVRNDEFLTTDYKNEDLVEPANGLYLVQKNVDEWVRQQAFPPGEDLDKTKKLMWKKFSDEMSNQLTIQLTNWLKDDIVPALAVAINEQIKMADITVTIPPTSVLVPVPITPATPTGTAPTITGIPVPPTNITIT